MTLGDFTAFNSYLVILDLPGHHDRLHEHDDGAGERLVRAYRRRSCDAPEPARSATIASPLRGDIALSHVNVVLGGQGRSSRTSRSRRTPARGRRSSVRPRPARRSCSICSRGSSTPTSGRVEYDGRAHRRLRPGDAARQVGFVFQDSIIFNLTLRENIAFSTTVTDADLEKAIATAELDDFVARAAGGLDTVVSERGSSLSGGQKQRIMLARALALNPRVLLLDDFTARVDTATEREDPRERAPELSGHHAAVGHAADRAGRGLRPDHSADGGRGAGRRARTSSCSRRRRNTRRSMTPSAAPANTNSTRSVARRPGRSRRASVASLGRLLPLMATERKSVTIACVAVDRRRRSPACSAR